MMLMAYRCVVPASITHWWIPDGFLQITDSLAPRELHRLRIYERMTPNEVLAKLDKEDRAVIVDAILERSIQRREQADKLLDDSGLPGAWRPSTIQIDHFEWLGGARLMVGASGGALAHTLWDLPIGDLGPDAPDGPHRFITLGRGDGFRLRLTNDEPFSRELFVHVLLRPMGSTTHDPEGHLLKVAQEVERSSDVLGKIATARLKESFDSHDSEGLWEGLRQLSDQLATLASAVGRTKRGA